jgi:hypothetical protein
MSSATSLIHQKSDLFHQNVKKMKTLRGACGRVLDATVSAIWFRPAVASGTQPQAPAAEELERQFFAHLPKRILQRPGGL